MLIRSMTAQERQAIADWLARNTVQVCKPSLAPVCVPVPREASAERRRTLVALTLAELHRPSQFNR